MLRSCFVLELVLAGEVRIWSGVASTTSKRAVVGDGSVLLDARTAMLAACTTSLARLMRRSPNLYSVVTDVTSKMALT